MAVLAVFAASGGGLAGASAPAGAGKATPYLQPDGPLRGVMMTGPLPDAGPPADWRLAFSTIDRGATAVIGLDSRAPEGVKLRVAWYRLEGPGKRTRLFTHRLKVRAGGGLALSRGVAERGLAPGTYEVVARMGDREVRVVWVVRVADEDTGGGGGRRSLPVEPAGDEDWSVPEAGDRGWYQPDPPAEPSAPSPCRVDSIDGSMSPMTDVRASAWFVGECSSRTLTVAVSGPPVELASSTEPATGASSLHGAVNVCTDLSGGSDLPGTVVHYAATGSDGAGSTSDYTLPDLGEIGPVVGIETEPPAGTRVEAGDTIKVRAAAMLVPPALGVKVLYLSDGDELLEAVPNLSGSSEPVACELRRYVAMIQSYRYKVPENPPPVVSLTADSIDFEGRRGEYSTESVSFPTVAGELWQGTISGGFQFPGCGAGTVSGDITVTVDHREVSGPFELEASSFDCGGGTTGSVTLSGRVTGRKTRDGLELSFGGGMNPAAANAEIHGRQAGGPLRYTGPNPEFVYLGHPNGQEVTLECISCADRG